MIFNNFILFLSTLYFYIFNFTETLEEEFDFDVQSPTLRKVSYGILNY